MSQKKPEDQKFPSTLRRVKKVKTNENGKLIQPTKQLEPNTRYFLCEDVFIPPARKMKSRKKVVEWIEKCVLGDLRTLILGIQERERKGKTQSPTLGGGNFLLAAGCCMALEYFSQVYGEGKNATKSVQEYVEKFLKPIDARYIKVWPILWPSFRNGIIHASWPQKICMGGSEIAIGADNSPDGDHLGPASHHEGKSFVISSYRFFCDIERSFNIKKGFRDWILHESDEEILERSAPRLLEIKSSNNEGKDAFDEIVGMNTQAEENSYGTPPSEG